MNMAVQDQDIELITQMYLATIPAAELLQKVGGHIIYYG